MSTIDPQRLEQEVRRIIAQAETEASTRRGRAERMNASDTPITYTQFTWQAITLEGMAALLRQALLVASRPATSDLDWDTLDTNLGRVEAHAVSQALYEFRLPGHTELAGTMSLEYLGPGLATATLTVFPGGRRENMLTTEDVVGTSVTTGEAGPDTLREVAERIIAELTFNAKDAKPDGTTVTGTPDGDVECRWHGSIWSFWLLTGQPDDSPLPLGTWDKDTRVVRYTHDGVSSPAGQASSVQDAANMLTRRHSLQEAAIIDIDAMPGGHDSGPDR